MKRTALLLFFILFFLTVCTSIFAQEPAVPHLNVSLLSTELNAWNGQPMQLTPFGTETSADDTRDRVIGVVLNLLVPGLGSLVIGDTSGGLSIMAGSVVSAAAFYGGYIWYAATSLNYGSTSQISSIALMAGGAGGMLGFGIYNIARPIVYVNHRSRV